MTAVSTLDAIDWATCLDAAPKCENPVGCDRPATRRVRWFCGCMDLACRPCIESVVTRLTTVLLERGLASFTHEGHGRGCGAHLTVRHLSELLTVVPL